MLVSPDKMQAMQLRFLVPLFLAACLAIPAATHRDIPFAKRGERQLMLDIYVPEGTGPHPVVVIVHGGGYIAGNKRTYVNPLFPVLSEAGFAWVSVDYRLAPKVQFEEMVKDVEDAVRWVKKRAGYYHLDTRRMALLGESAGGHLVAWVGATSAPKLGIAAVVPFYAPLDLVTRAKTEGEVRLNFQQLAGIGRDLTPENLERLRRISPHYFVHKAMPPHLFIHGPGDKQVAYAQSEEMHRKMQGLGAPSELFTVEGGGHGMENWEKEKVNPAWKAKMVAWLQTTLANGTAAK